MARHRRPPLEAPPLELLVFRGGDWISDDDMPPLERGGMGPGLIGREGASG